MNFGKNGPAAGGLFFFFFHGTDGLCSGSGSSGSKAVVVAATEAPFKVTANGTFGTANGFRRGERAVRITWLHFLGDDKDGNRKCEAHDKDAPLVFPVDGLVHTACPHLTPQKFKNTRGTYTLGAEQHEQILLCSHCDSARGLRATATAMTRHGT